MSTQNVYDYYCKKYPVWYPAVCNDDGAGYSYFFTIPVRWLARIYRKKMGEKPTSFFDCGCGIGSLLFQGEQLGLKVKGIDIEAYPPHYKKPQNIEIVSIVDYQKPIDYDIAFCNGTLTYLNEETVTIALQKLKAARLLIVIHDTTEDYEASGGCLSERSEPRLIRSQKWWLNKLKQVGFDAEYDVKSGCFLAKSPGRQHA